MGFSESRAGRWTIWTLGSLVIAGGLFYQLRPGSAADPGELERADLVAKVADGVDPEALGSSLVVPSDPAWFGVAIGYDVHRGHICLFVKEDDAARVEQLAEVVGTSPGVVAVERFPADDGPAECRSGQGGMYLGD